MSSDGSEPGLIGVDWGTSSFRAFLMNGAGEVLSARSSDQGILFTGGRGFEDILNEQLHPWSGSSPPAVIVSGMITSKNGWVETPYFELPAGEGELASNLVTHSTSSGLHLHLVGGLISRRDGVPDVMRGEETQIVGLLADGVREGTVVMPGTHSKWVALTAGAVDHFATFMTGEFFSALRDSTILGRQMANGPASPSAFSRGVERARSGGPELLHAVFSTRTHFLFQDLAAEDSADYLSGLLIGAEIQGALSLLGPTADVWLVGGADLVERYETALRICGIQSRRAKENIAAHGHFAIARAGGLLR